LGGTWLVHKEEMEGGVKIHWGEPNLHTKRKRIGEESSKVMHRKETNGGGKFGEVTNNTIVKI